MANLLICFSNGKADRPSEKCFMGMRRVDLLCGDTYGHRYKARLVHIEYGDRLKRKSFLSCLRKLSSETFSRWTSFAMSHLTAGKATRRLVNKFAVALGSTFQQKVSYYHGFLSSILKLGVWWFGWNELKSLKLHTMYCYTSFTFFQFFDQQLPFEFHKKL